MQRWGLGAGLLWALGCGEGSAGAVDASAKDRLTHDELGEAVELLKACVRDEDCAIVRPDPGVCTCNTVVNRDQVDELLQLWECLDCEHGGPDCATATGSRCDDGRCRAVTAATR